MASFARAGRIALMIVAGALVVALLAAVYLLVRTRVPPAEITEAVTSQGDYQLRDPMRPARRGARVLVVAVDGVGYDELVQAIDQGKMPHLRRLLGRRSGNSFAHGYLARSMSSLPSTTMSAWATIFTGKPPSQTGVPGNEWFDRTTMSYLAPAPVTVDEYAHTVLMLTDGLLNNQVHVPTLFEIVNRRAFVALAPIYRGADYFTTPTPEIVGGAFLGVTKGVVGVEQIDREIYEELDQENGENLVEAIEAHGVPDLTVVYFPGIDLYTHVAEEPLIKESSYLQEVIDEQIGEIVEAYRKADALDSTYVMVISDHGHTPVLENDRHALGVDGDDEPTALLTQLGFRLRENTLAPEDSSYQAAVAYQGAIAYVYLADRSTCMQPGSICDWKRPPRMEEDVLAVARGFYEANRSGKGLPSLRGTLDLIFARQPQPAGKPTVPFQVFDGTKLVPIGQYVREHNRKDLIDLERRMNALSAGPYGHLTGDVLLLARSGLERPIGDRYYFSREYRSWHGSPTAQDSYVPILVACRSQRGSEIEARLRAVLGPSPSHERIVPAIATLLGK